jgi:hypothetical protein
MPQLHATCHCGAVKLTIPRAPQTLTNCNCSICRRYGVLWCYWNESEVSVEGPTEDYIWGDRMLRFERCVHCGVVVAWRGLPFEPEGRMAINARNFDPLMLGDVRIRRLDGAKTWKVVE